MNKVCKKCNKSLPVSEFYPQITGKSGIHSRCKTCESNRHKEAYLASVGKTQALIHKHTIDKCHEHAASHGGTCLSTIYINASTKYIWLCSCGHKWEASLPTTKDRWCSKCAIEKRNNTKLAKYGDPFYNNRTKSEETCLKRYGSKSNMGDRDISLKNAKARNNSYTLSHWKTNEEVVCQGKWERNVVTYLNSNKIEYKWQIPFNLSNGKTYIIDFYDVKRDTYVEIKGWWRDDGLAKYTLFKTDYPFLLTEVWQKEELKSKGILIRDLLIKDKHETTQL